MAATILAWAYITAVCWTWGDLTLSLLQRSSPKANVHFTIVCMTGLSIIGILCGYLSLFMALGGPDLHLFFTLVGVLHARQYLKKPLFSLLKREITNLHISVILLFAVSIVLLLVMSTWHIMHPDTLAYHAPLIRWMETYKAVPGLVHLNERYGLQSVWFGLCAVFSFRFLQGTGLTYINAAVLMWFVCFLVHNINKHSEQTGRKSIASLLWLLLLVTSMIHYTEVRLTATSASPDFITVIYIWLTCYLFLCRWAMPVSDKLVFLFALTAITIKLSAAPLFLFGAYFIIKDCLHRQWKSTLLLLTTGLLILFPLLYRNIITSGYAAFPLTAVDVAQVDWKYNKEATNLVADYIKAYARNHAVVKKEEIEELKNMPLHQWVPIWWRQNEPTEKVILGAMALAVVLLALFPKKLLGQASFESKIILAISAAGILFWFITAPAMRFGVGYILVFTGLILYTLGINFFKTTCLHEGLFTICMIAVSLGLFSYAIYRFAKFFEWKQGLVPAGISPITYQTVNCNGFTVHIPIGEGECGDTPVPCVYNCANFLFRGSAVTDGFKAKQ